MTVFWICTEGSAGYLFVDRLQIRPGICKQKKAQRYLTAKVLSKKIG